MTGTVTDEQSRLMFRLALYQVVKKERDQMTTSQERLSKLIRSFERLSQKFLMSKFQYQNNTK